jgi:peptidoglycan/LPS O-acetylase OafA/YrhL
LLKRAELLAPDNPETNSDALESGAHFLPTLDGWRAIAVLSVLLGHFLVFSSGHLPGGSGISKLGESLGPLGVNLFFAISGYLITTRLLAELDQRGSISLRRFYIRRAFRILPPALAYLLIVAILGALGIITLHWGEIPSAVFFYNNYWPERSWYVSQFWSLSMEEQFYLFWPILLARLGVRRAACAAICLIIVTSLWRNWALAHKVAGAYALHRTDLRLDAFMFPVLFAILLRFPAWRRILSRVGDEPVLAAIVAIVAGSYLAVYHNPDLQNLKTLVISALMPLMIIGTVLKPVNGLGRFLEWPQLAWLGRISYGVYLFHKLFEIPAASLIDVVLRFPLHLAIVVCCAASSYYLMEKPLNRIGRNLAKA